MFYDCFPYRFSSPPPSTPHSLALLAHFLCLPPSFSPSFLTLSPSFSFLPLSFPSPLPLPLRDICSLCEPFVVPVYQTNNTKVLNEDCRISMKATRGTIRAKGEFVQVLPAMREERIFRVWRDKLRYMTDLIGLKE